MDGARKVVFYSARQEDAEQKRLEKFLERQKHLAEYRKDLPIIIVLTVLFGTLAVLIMGPWQGGFLAALIFVDILLALEWRYDLGE